MDNMKSGKKVPFSACMPEAILNMGRKYAMSIDRSFSWVVTIAVAEFVEREQRDGCNCGNVKEKNSGKKRSKIPSRYCGAVIGS